MTIEVLGITTNQPRPPGPKGPIKCPLCGYGRLTQTGEYRALQTGIWERLDWCEECMHSFSVRFDPKKDAQYILCDVYYPIRSKNGKVRPRLAFPRKRIGGK